MSRGVNKVFIVGNLGKDPDLRTTQAGAQIVNLNVATDESYRDRTSGQLVPKTEWHRVVIFGRTAEIAAQYLKKGSKVYLEGRLQTRKWQTQDGFDRYTTEIVVDISGQMQMLDGPGGNSSSDSSTTNFNHQPSGDTSGNLKNDGGPNCPPELDDFDVIPF